MLHDSQYVNITEWQKRQCNVRVNWKLPLKKTLQRPPFRKWRSLHGHVFKDDTVTLKIEDADFIR